MQVRLALEAAGMGAWKFDAVSNVITTLRGAGPITSLPDPQYPHNMESFAALLHPDDRERVLQAVTDALELGRQYRVEFRICPPGGQVRWVSALGTGIRNATGMAVALTGVDLDITDRKQAEESLLLNTQRVEAMLTLNQMIDAPIKEITDFAMEAAIRLTGSKLGYVAFANEDQTVLTMQSWSKAAMAECQIADKPLVYPVQQRGSGARPSGSARRSSRTTMQPPIPSSGATLRATWTWFAI